MAVSRRELFQSGAATAAAVTFGPAWLREALAAPARAGKSPYGALQPADENSLMLPPGFKSRMVARSLAPVAGTTYIWPIFPDGQATFRTEDGGWILVTNSESIPESGAGSSAIRFGRNGGIKDAYRILGDTNVNCAGGPSRWGTWLSCEEADDGMVWECDPAGKLEAEPRPALGVFKHEAVTVDPVAGQLYLTEDNSNAGFYRFTPKNYPDLDKGELEVAVADEKGRVRWKKVPDPTTAKTGKPTRQQVPEMTRFNNGEGIWYAEGVVYFTTKVDKVVWAYDARKKRIEKLFDRQLALDSSLDAVDNVTVTAAGDVLVCEDGGNMEIGLITSDREVSPLIRFVGPDHSSSEVCGVVFDPSGKRMYCTSQRAFAVVGPAGRGAVYEIEGPFRVPKGGNPEAFVFGPPAGEVRPKGPLNPGADKKDPGIGLRARKGISRGRFLEDGLTVKVRSSEAGTIAVKHHSLGLVSEPGNGGSTDRPRSVLLSRAKARVEAGGGSVEIHLPAPRGRAKRLLKDADGDVSSRLLVSVVDGAGNESALTHKVLITA